MPRKSTDRPNILYLVADQQKAAATVPYGNRLIDCPCTERFAREGVVFNNAHVVSTICTPSRASVMTGVHPLVHQVHCWQNNAPWNLSQLAELFTAGGYYTGVAGHYELGQNLGRGWHEQADLFARGGGFGEALDHKYSSGRGSCGYSSGSLDIEANEGHSALLGNKGIQMIDNAQTAGAPFFLHVSFNDPHPPYFAPPPFDTLVDPEAVTLPDPGGAGRPQWQSRARNEVGYDTASPLELRQALAVYYGMIAYVDTQMERIYQALETRNLLENTWIVFAADHGDFMGEKGLFEKCEVPYGCLTHVPLIIVPPRGQPRPGPERVDHMVQSVDLFPTLLGLAGMEVPTYAQGKDLISWVHGGAAEPLHDCLFAQVGDYQGDLKNTFPGGTFESGRRKALVQSARTTMHLYIRDDQCGDEGYDLRTDPFELSNELAVDAAQPAWAESMRRRVEDWEKACLALRAQLGVVPGERGF